MKEYIERVPISIGGAILGITAMGNLLYDYMNYSRQICGTIECRYNNEINAISKQVSEKYIINGKN